MMGKGKGALALLLGPAKDKAAPEESDNADLEVAAGDLLAAIEAKDPAAVAGAFEAMHTICNSYEGE